MRLENTDYILFTDEKERAETALEDYLEGRNGKKRDVSVNRRYFVIGESELTIIEDIRIGSNTIYNEINWYDGKIEIERNVEYEEVEELLSSH